MAFDGRPFSTLTPLLLRALSRTARRVFVSRGTGRCPSECEWQATRDMTAVSCSLVSGTLGLWARCSGRLPACLRGPARLVHERPNTEYADSSHLDWIDECRELSTVSSLKTRKAQPNTGASAGLGLTCSTEREIGPIKRTAIQQQVRSVDHPCFCRQGTDEAREEPSDNPQAAVLSHWPRQPPLRPGKITKQHDSAPASG